MSGRFAAAQCASSLAFSVIVRRWLAWSCAIALATLVAACGGGGGGSPPPQPHLTLTGQPADVSVVDGDSAAFAVQASAAATYQWQRADAGGAWGDIPGATAAAYTLAVVHAGDDGSQYRAIVTSASVSALTLVSSAATLHVAARQVAPAIVVTPADANVVEGQVASFSVTASGTSLTYQWQSASGGDGFADVDGATAPTLALPPTSLAEDGARFRVIVSNGLGTVTSGAVRLAVAPAPAAPVFKETPADASVVEGSPVTFVVTVIGSPAPTLRWQSSRDGASWTDLPGETLASLTLAAPAIGDDGMLLRAVATNASGSVPTPPARLSVAPRPAAPLITRQPAGVTVGVGATPTFSVGAAGVPAPAYQWQVSRDAGATFANVNGADGPAYEVPATVEGDDGLVLRVVVSNASGTLVSDGATMTVIPVPHISRQPETQAWHVGEGTPMFQVVAAGDGLAYQWQVRAAATADFVDVPGETAATYFHTGGPSDPTTAVRVRITNARGGVAVSDAAQLVALTWRTLHPIPTADDLTAVRWVDASTVVAVGEGGTIIRSVDAGQTWSATVEQDPAHAFRLAAVDFNSAQVGIAVGQGGWIRRTTDGGVHWISIRPSQPTTGGYNGRYTGLYDVAFADDQTVVATNGSRTLLHSDDAGQTWTSVDAGVGITRVVFHHGVGIALSTAGVLRSINGGMQWEVIPGSDVVQAVSPNAIAFGDDSVVVIVGWMGIARSADGGLTWQVQTQGFDWSMLRSVGFTDARHGVAIGSASTGPQVYSTSDGGVTWTPEASWNPVYSTFAATAFSASGIGVTVGELGLIRRSADAGATWTDGPGNLDHGHHVAESLAFPTPSLGMMVGFGTMLRTTDGGANWQAVDTPLNTPTSQWSKVVFLDAGHAFAVQAWGTLAETTDGGATWIDRSASVDFMGQQVDDMQFGPDHRLGLISAGGRVWRTTDAGATWSLVSPIVSPGPFGFFAFGSTLDVVASAWDGSLEASHDGGLTWTRTAPMGFNHFSLNPVFLDATTVLATADGLEFRSTDAGRTWTTIEDSTEINPLMRGPATFVSSTEGFMIDVFGSVAHTTDGGLTWATMPAARAGGMYRMVVRAPHELWAVRGGALAVTHY